MKRLGSIAARASLVLGLGALAPGLPEANAAFLPFLVSSDPSGAYNYRLIFATSNDPNTGTPLERLDPYGGPIPPPLPLGSLTGGFATIYDFPFANSVTVPANFQFTIQNLGINSIATNVGDSPLLSNVTFYYTGPTLTTDTIFTGFTVNSAITGGLTQIGRGGGQTNRNAGPLEGTPIGFVNFVNIPMIPEPASIALVGLGGLVVLSFYRRRSA
jgi:hypothetical protein